ncbi:MAG: ATP synthase F1 subunit delta [Proteobacteria bacterium]|nr:ATP synthase F1 subunit delta [Pseudomonadota bacterium]
MSAASSTAATRYAQALFQLASQSGKSAAVTQAVETLAASITDSTIAETLQNPRLQPTQRLKLADSMAKAIQAPLMLASTLGLLAQNNRLALLPQVLAAYQTLADAASATTRVQLTSAVALTEAQRTKLIENIKTFTKSKQVEVTETVQPSLIAGFRALFANQVWDTSVATGLTRLKTQLIRTAKQI